jgi:hypothetical protein
VQLTVTRAGDTTAASTVSYRTVDDPAAVPCDPTIKQPGGQPYAAGTAYARCDYATTIDTVTFAPGETQKTITVPVVDDGHVEGAETFRVVLYGPAAGTTLGGSDACAVTITDDDTEATPNPLDTVSFFVRQHYLDFLNREPEAGEPWTATLNNCAAGDTRCDRISVSAAFFGSPEFRLKGFYVFTFYKVAFGRLPAYDEIIPDMRSVTGTTPEEVYSKRAQFAASFAQRAEFAAGYPSSLTDQQYVDALMSRYALPSITTPDPANPDAGGKVVLTGADLAARLGATGPQALTRAQVLRAVVQSDEVSAAESNKAFVAMQYYGYLRRAPEEPGYTNWLNQINLNPGDFRTMVNGFMNSVEYKRRFGQP